ncbi:MAG: carboxypeptidase-like regulatory domain-containing protein [Spirochaetota bacterium]
MENNKNYHKKTVIKINYFLILFLLLSIYIILFSCSSVFRASLTGRYIDSETEDGIDDGYVFLYTSEDKFKEDWNDYQTTKDYNTFFTNSFCSTTTTTTNNQSGVFTFNAIVWSTLTPLFGKDADVQQIYLVFYHEDYDASYSTQKLVSDSTTRLTPIKVDRIKNSATIHGIVSDVSSGNGIANVTVRIYVPKSWTFDSNDEPNVIDDDFETSPSYTTTTNANGEYTVKISFAKMPSLTDDKGKTKVRIIISLTDFETSSDIDPNFIDNTTWDPDGNGKYEDYYESSSISKDTTTQIPVLKMRRTLFNESINGIVKLSGNGVNGYKVVVKYKTRNGVLTQKSTRTYTYYPNDQVSVIGYFEITNLELAPDGTEGTQNYQQVVIEIYDPLDSLQKSLNFKVYENSDNYIEINLP